MHLVMVTRCALVAAAMAFLGCAGEGASSGGTGGTGGAGGSGSTGGTGGAGGIAGTGGIGGSGGIGGTGGDAGGAGGAGGTATGWWDDPAIWKPIPGGEAWWNRCQTLQADSDAIRRPVLAWEPCGTGCERASLDLGSDFNPGSPSITVSDGAVLSGAILNVSTSRRSLDDRSRIFRSTIRLDDGMLIAMAQIGYRPSPAGGVAPCSVFRRARSMVTAVGTDDDDGVSRVVLGFVDEGTGTHAWFPPWTPDPVCEPLPVAAADGPRLFFGCGVAGYYAPAGGPAEAHVVSGDGAVITGSASSFQDLAVWSEERPGGNSRIRAWSATTGTRTLIDTLPGVTCHVAVGADRIVGWAVPPNGWCDSLGPGLKLWHAPLRPDGSVGAVQEVPAFWAGKMLPDLFSSRSGHAAFYAGMQDPSGTSSAGVVVRLADGHARRIVAQPGYEVHYGAIAVTDRHVYWAEGEHVSYDGRVSVVYRHELAQLDTLGEPLGTGAD